jgi:hypothetical protein
MSRSSRRRAASPGRAGMSSPMGTDSECRPFLPGVRRG